MFPTAYTSILIYILFNKTLLCTFRYNGIVLIVLYYFYGMQKIASFIMSKKFLPIVFALTAISIFIASRTQGSTENEENPKAKNERILRNVGILLEQGHVHPRAIDDAFSREVMKKYLKDMDGDKNIFIQADLDAFKVYENRIDDEIKGAPLESFYAMNTVYLKRVKEVSELYPDYLARPFDFSKDETLEKDADKLSAPASIAERNDRWRKQLKYLVLDRYVSLQEEREKNKSKKDFVVKPDSTLEREARDLIRKQMDRYYTTKMNRETEDANFSVFINAITGIMDPHTDYFPPIDLRTFKESMKGSFYGIGALLKEDDGKIKIASLVSGGPAWKSGELKENDEILKVAQGAEEPVDVTGYGVQDAVKIIRGSEKGSEVRLTVKHIDGSIKVITLKRDDIKLEDTFVKSAILNGEHKIGYIYLPDFYADFDKANGPRSGEDIGKEIKKLKAENVDGILIDLRGNGGGSLYDVIQAVGYFVGNGPVVQVKGRGDKVQVLPDNNKGILYTGPLAVLVDETSASASEIFAAAIQDYKRGIIIGSTSTYGKGSVQRNIALNPERENSIFGSSNSEDLGTVKLTLQKFYRISGGSNQLKGVIPDVVIPDRLEFVKFREKDNPYSLKWDEIKKADYKTWMDPIAEKSIVNAANEEVNKNPTFNKIKSEVDWLGKNANRSYSLNYEKFKQNQKQLKEVYKKIEDLYKLPAPMQVHNLAADTSSINTAQDKIEKNKVWLKAVGSDIYIDESTRVLNRMIQNGSLVKKD